MAMERAERLEYEFMEKKILIAIFHLDKALGLDAFMILFQENKEERKKERIVLQIPL